MRFVFFFIAMTIIVRCHPYKVYKIAGIDLNSIPADTIFRLRSDGLYNTTGVEIDTLEERFKIMTPLVILNNQKAITINDACINDTLLDLKNYFAHNFAEYVGEYVVHKDTIWAKLPIIFSGRGMIPKVYESYFQGEVRTQDTIVNWRMIPPYPKATISWNEVSLRRFKKPHQLYFIKNKAFLELNSFYQQQLKVK